jgi:hypothetical protein
VTKSKILVGVGAAAVTAAFAVASGCASILSIPERTADWCNRPENAHDFCEDFDHSNADAGGVWTVGVLPGSDVGFTTSSTDSPPSAVDLTTTAQSLGGQTVSGLFKQFDNEKFDHIVFGVDVRFVDIDLQSEAGLESQLGFLLVEEQGFCIGVVLTPGVMGMVYRANMMDCITVPNLPADGGKMVDDAGLTTFAPVGPIPMIGQWTHIALDIKRNANGSGTVGFNLAYPGVIAPPEIPAGYLIENSPPAIAVATSIVGPAGRVDVQFDNVTVDFPKD